MIITCPSCQTRYTVDPAQFGPKGRRVRCTSCENMWTVRPADDLPKSVDPEEPVPADGPEIDVAALAAAGAASPPETGGAVAKRAGGVGWFVLCTVVAAVVAGGALARDSIVRVWPPAERLYNAVGLPVAGPMAGLEIKIDSHDHTVTDGRTVLVIKGKVTNGSGDVRSLPKLAASLRGADAKELANWTFSAGPARLLPGETASFVTRFQNPPEGAAALSVDFSRKAK